MRPFIAAGLGATLAFEPDASMRFALQGSGFALEHLQVHQITCSVAAVQYDAFNGELESRTDHGLVAAVTGLTLSVGQGATLIFSTDSRHRVS